MAGNYIIVADFCDQAGPFFKFEKNHHIATRKPRFRFHLKTGSFQFRFENRHSTAFNKVGAKRRQKQVVSKLPRKFTVNYDHQKPKKKALFSTNLTVKKRTDYQTHEKLPSL